jgi:hypothetical protein
MNIDIGNKYIHAEPIGNLRGKPSYAIISSKNDDEIAVVEYYPKWGRYVITTEAAIFDVGCLESIIKFIKGLG